MRMTANRGFSLLELVIVIVIISVLIVVAISRLIALQEAAERASMESVVGTLRSAIGIRVATHIVKQNIPGLRRLVSTNPMDQLAQLPKNYLGVFDRPDPNTLEDGNWYFDRDKGILVYLVRSKVRFKGGKDNPPRARFRIRPVFTDRNRNGRYDPGRERIEGLSLSPVEPYTWKFD